MNEKRNIWFYFIGSFNPRFYRNIVYQSFARSFGYLSLFVFIVSLALSVKYTLNTQIAIQKSLEWMNAVFVEKLPEFLPKIYIKDGKISSPAEQPLIREWPDFVFILDTKGTITSLDKYKNGILVKEHTIIIKHSKRDKIQTEEYDLLKIKSMIKSVNIFPGKKEGELIALNFEGQEVSLMQNNIERWANIIGKAIFPLMVVSLFFYYLLTKIFQLFLFSLLSLIVNAVINAKLKYDNLLNIGILALTPPVVFSVLVVLLGLKNINIWQWTLPVVSTVLVGVFSLKISLFGLIYIGLYCLFLIMAIYRYKNINSYYP